MDTPDKSKRTARIVSFFIYFLGAVSMIVPSVLDIDMDEGGGAMLMIGGTIVVIALSEALAHWLRRTDLKQMMFGESLLAHWTYGEDQWQEHVADEFETRAGTARKIWIGTVAAAAIIGLFLLLFTSFDYHLALFVTGLPLLLGGIAWLAPRLRRGSNRRRSAEAFISAEALLFKGRMLKWNDWSPRLEAVALKESPTRALVFSYTYKSRRHHRYSTEISIPVPKGERKKADEIVSFFKESLNRQAVDKKTVGSNAPGSDAAGIKAALGEALKPRIEQLRRDAVAESEENKIRRGRFFRVVALLAAVAIVVLACVQVFLYFSSRNGLEYTAEGHSEGIWELAVSGDGTLIATASSSSALTSDRSVRLLRASDGALLRVFYDDEPVSTLEFSPDGKRLAVGRYRKVTVFDAAAGNAVCTMPILDFDAPARLRFSADGRRLAGWGSAVYLWDSSTGSLLLHERCDDGWYFGDAAFNTAGVLLTAEIRDDSIRLRDAGNGLELWRIITDAAVGPSSVCNVAISRDGALLASQTETGTTLIDTKSGSVLRRVESRAEGMAMLEFSPRATHLVHKAVLGEAKVWDVNTGACVLTAPGEDNPYPSVSSDGALCAVLRDGGLVKVYETSSGSEVAAFRHRESVMEMFPDANLIAFPPDGRRLITVCERVHVWRIPG